MGVIHIMTQNNTTATAKTEKELYQILVASLKLIDSVDTNLLNVYVDSLNIQRI